MAAKKKRIVVIQDVVLRDLYEGIQARYHY